MLTLKLAISGALCAASLTAQVSSAPSTHKKPVHRHTSSGTAPASTVHASTAAKPKTTFVASKSSTARPSVSSAKSGSSSKSGVPAQSLAASRSSAATKSSPTAKSAATAKVATTAKSGSKKPGSKKAVAVSRRSYQQQPTPDRYREIQQALSERGYFAGQPDGNWGPDSTEALKRFQRDQNLPEDGKLGSLSLIALGLGPRRAAPTEAAEEASAADKSLFQPVQH